MAQLGGALLEISMMEEDTPLPRCVHSNVQSKFRGFVLPGDKVVFRAKAESMHEDSARVSVKGKWTIAASVRPRLSMYI